jgi:hypothetical protein
LSASGTDDTSWIKESEEFKELLERLWSKWEGKKITRSPRNWKTSKRSFAEFLAGVIAAAYRAGIQDPLKNIDWEHVLNPDLSQAKNLSLLEQRYGIRAEEVSGRRRKKQTPPGGTEEGMLRFQIAFLESEIADLDFMIAHGEDKHGNRLTPEQVEDAKRRKAELEGQLEELRRRLERLKRGRITAWLPREAPWPAPSARPAEGRAPQPLPHLQLRRGPLGLPHSLLLRLPRSQPLRRRGGGSGRCSPLPWPPQGLTRPSSGRSLRPSTGGWPTGPTRRSWATS